MSTGELGKEQYRSIISAYFLSFGTHDFSAVQFSSNIEFLSPISGNTMKGRDEVVKFVSGVATRVAKVNILSTTVDFPTASGVWQMMTTEGVQYTLHNFFRLDGEGILYIWPMFDPKAVMNDPPGLISWLTGKGYYSIAATTPKQLAGVTISRTGRMFVNFPRWVDVPTPSVAEVAADGSLVPYPSRAINEWDKEPGESAGSHFVCVQSVVADEDDMLWVLDPASPAFQRVVPGGAKLLKVNLATNAIERVYRFDNEVAPPASYLNDVRLAHGFAFMTDSGLGAVVTLDLSTGKARRLLENHTSTKAEPGVELVIGRRPWKFADNTTPQVHSDGIAIDAERKYVYYKALTGRTLYRVPIAALIDESLSPATIGDHVERVAVTQPTDGLEFDAKGNLYMTALEENAIKVLRPDGRFEVFAKAPEFLWPDTITMSGDGDLIFSATQFHLMPAFNQGVDMRNPPYNVFRLKIS
jgi:sugar lactone lactonase YvrE